VCRLCVLINGCVGCVLLCVGVLVVCWCVVCVGVLVVCRSVGCVMVCVLMYIIMLV